MPGFLPAVLVVPAGTQPRPLLVAAHGAGGAPEWDCDYWSRLIADRAFVLCPRGTAMSPGSFYFKQHYALGAEVAAATADGSKVRIGASPAMPAVRVAPASTADSAKVRIGAMSPSLPKTR